MSEPTCIGFGELEGRCENEATANEAKLWCPTCEAVRIAHISAQMQKISGSFPKP